MPTRHGAPSACGPIARTSPPRLTSPCAMPASRAASRRGRPRTPCRCRRSRSPCRRAAAAPSSLVPLDLRPADERQQRRRAPRRVGRRGGSRRKSHARRSTPDVMSKRPPDSVIAAVGVASSAAVSASIATGAPPAARLIARGHAVVAIARVLRLDALHVGDRRLGRAARAGRRRRGRRGSRAPRPSRGRGSGSARGCQRGRRRPCYVRRGRLRRVRGGRASERLGDADLEPARRERPGCPGCRRRPSCHSAFWR